MPNRLGRGALARKVPNAQNLWVEVGEVGGLEADGV